MIPREFPRIFSALGIALLFSLGASLASGDALIAREPLLAKILWCLAIGILIWIGIAGQEPLKLKTQEVVAITLIAFAALLTRLYRLSQGPPMLSGDEANFARTALEFINGTRTNIFNVGWFSFPSFYSFLQSFPLRFLPREPYTIRLSSVLAGTLTVISTYLYAKLAFGKRVATASAVVLAFLGYHIHFSRLGWNNIWDGLFAVLLALLLSQAWRSNRPAAYVLPGIALGLAQYFYVGSRVFILLIPVWGLLILKVDQTRARFRIQGLAILAISTTVVVLPLALFFVRHPLEFLAPMARISLFGRWWTLQTVHYGDPGWLVISEQVLKALLGFVTVPLTSIYAGQPILNPPLAALFLIGLVVLIKQRKEPDSLWLGLWLLGVVMAVIFSDKPPAGQRYVLSSGAVAIVTAIGFNAVLSWIPRTVKNRTVIVKIFACLFLASALWQTYHYFVIYPTRDALIDFNGLTVVEVANSLQELEVQKAYFFVSPRMALASQEVIRFLTPTLSGEDIAHESHWQVEIPDPDEYAFVFLPERESALDTVRACIPRGATHRITAPGGYLLSVIYIVDVHAPTVCTGP